jgi:hypothetical protein
LHDSKEAYGSVMGQEADMMGGESRVKGGMIQALAETEEEQAGGPGQRQAAPPITVV